MGVCCATLPVSERPHRTVTGRVDPPSREPSPPPRGRAPTSHPAAATRKVQHPVPASSSPLYDKEAEIDEFFENFVQPRQTKAVASREVDDASPFFLSTLSPGSPSHVAPVDTGLKSLVEMYGLQGVVSRSPQRESPQIANRNEDRRQNAGVVPLAVSFRRGQSTRAAPVTNGQNKGLAPSSPRQTEGARQAARAPREARRAQPVMPVVPEPAPAPAPHLGKPTSRRGFLLRPMYERDYPGAPQAEPLSFKISKKNSLRGAPGSKPASVRRQRARDSKETAADPATPRPTSRKGSLLRPLHERDYPVAPEAEPLSLKASPKKNSLRGAFGSKPTSVRRQRELDASARRLNASAEPQLPIITSIRETVDHTKTPSGSQRRATRHGQPTGHAPPAAAGAATTRFAQVPPPLLNADQLQSAVARVDRGPGSARGPSQPSSARRTARTQPAPLRHDTADSSAVPGLMTVSQHIRATTNPEGAPVKSIMQSSIKESKTPKAADNLGASGRNGSARHWVVQRRQQTSDDAEADKVATRGVHSPPPPQRMPVAADPEGAPRRLSLANQPPPPTQPPVAPPAVAANGEKDRVSGGPAVPSSSSQQRQTKQGTEAPKGLPSGESFIPPVREERAVGRSRWKGLPPMVTPVPKGPSPKPTASSTDFYVDSLDGGGPAGVASEANLSQSAEIPVDTPHQQRRLSDHASRPPPPAAAPLPQRGSQASEEKPMKPIVVVPAAARRPDPGNAALGATGPKW